MLAKATRRVAEWIFSSPKVIVGQPMDKANSTRRMVFWQNSEWISDDNFDHLKSEKVSDDEKPSQEHITGIFKKSPEF